MVLYLCAGVPLLSHAVTPVEQAFINGQAIAQGATSNASTNITNGTIATTVNSFNPSYYTYSTTAPEASYFMAWKWRHGFGRGGKGSNLSDRTGQSKRLPSAKL